MLQIFFLNDAFLEKFKHAQWITIHQLFSLWTFYAYDVIIHIASSMLQSYTLNGEWNEYRTSNCSFIVFYATQENSSPTKSLALFYDGDHSCFFSWSLIPQSNEPTPRVCTLDYTKNSCAIFTYVLLRPGWSRSWQIQAVMRLHNSRSEKYCDSWQEWMRTYIIWVTQKQWRKLWKGLSR